MKIVWRLAVLILSLAGSTVFAQTRTASGWEQAKEALERFARNPSCSTAREFYSTISETPRIADDKTDLLDHVFSQRLDINYRRYYPIIAIEMLQGNFYAARSAIRLLDFIDQGWQKPRLLTDPVGQYVGETLGELIRINPELFLKACYEEREISFLKKNGYPVRFISHLMNKKYSRAGYELEMRRKALLSVKDTELLSIRDECVDSIDREIEKIGLDNATTAERQEGAGVDLRTKIINAFVEMGVRPSPENMKKVLAFFPAGKGNTPFVLLNALIPLGEPFLLILQEARCGNEYAIEILFRNLAHHVGAGAQMTWRELSNLILTKPSLFVEKLAKYAQLLNSVDSMREGDREPPRLYIEGICTIISYEDYPDHQLACNNVILNRRIEALEALNMPEHKEIINRCIQLMKGKLIEEIVNH